MTVVRPGKRKPSVVRGTSVCQKRSTGVAERNERQSALKKIISARLRSRPNCC